MFRFVTTIQTTLFQLTKNDMEAEETTPELDFDPRKKPSTDEEETDDTASIDPEIDPEFFEGDDEEETDDVLDTEEMNPFGDKWEE